MSPGSRNSFALDESRRLARRMTALRLRARMVRAIRRHFTEKGYLEVETPQLIPAPPPETHINPVKAGSFYLHTSPELHMKRLLAAGFEKLFQITKCFREGERGHLHLPEFTLLEWYSANLDYKGLMVECEDLFGSLTEALGSGTVIDYQDVSIDLQRPWERLTVEEAFTRYASLRLDEALGAGTFDEVMANEIEPRLGLEGPVFVYDYPASRAALAKLVPTWRRYAERFELYIGGLELANGFSELNDPREQEQRFHRARQERRELGHACPPIPVKFLAALGNMPDAAGIALGFDRLVMLFSDARVIDDVVAFTPEEA